MPPTAPPTMNFGVTLQGKASRNLSEAVQRANVLKQGNQVSRKPTATAKEQHRPPEKQSVLKHLREIQERNKQKPTQKQRKKSIDRDSR